MKKAILFAVVIALLGAGSGCARRTMLLPAAGAQVSDLPGQTATGGLAGVKVMAAGNAWAGRSGVEEHVLPLRVYIENNHGTPIRIRYSDFVLAGDDGSRSAALPPLQIEGRIAEFYESYFPMRGYYGGPYHSPVHPYMGPSWGRSFYERDYYDRYYGAWRDIELPTKEMLEQALSEGVIEHGAGVSGFLYFDKVDPDVPQVIFKMELIEARTNERFGTISIPFVVVKK